MRPEYSATAALNIVTNDLQNDFNQKKPCNHSLLVALYLTTTFDQVDHSLLLRGILDEPLANSKKRWFGSYLQVRFSLIEEFNRKFIVEKSKRVCRLCGVLSPMLFNMYISKLLLTIKDITMTFYAEDITLNTSHLHIETLLSLITHYLNI